MSATKCTLFQAALSKAAHLHTMTGLAAKCGIQRVTLTNYATGRSRPSVEALRSLSDALDPEERAPLILAHLLDECPYSARPFLVLELSPLLESVRIGEPVSVPDPGQASLDGLFAGLRHLAETRQDVREWLAQSLELIR